MLSLIIQRGTPFSGPVHTGSVDKNYVSEVSTEEILISILIVILIGAFVIQFVNKRSNS
ncbi:hypothetical protein T190611E02C_10927 [Tenacibaculum sp. 190524A05c]|uniref:hypothetical protein n=1 Tax=Tenacibaculum platacis TaxID=3137852 RepID=UPI0031FAB494